MPMCHVELWGMDALLGVERRANIQSVDSQAMVGLSRGVPWHAVVTLFLLLWRGRTLCASCRRVFMLCRYRPLPSGHFMARAEDCIQRRLARTPAGRVQHAAPDANDPSVCAKRACCNNGGPSSGGPRRAQEAPGSPRRPQEIPNSKRPQPSPRSPQEI